MGYFDININCIDKHYCASIVTIGKVQDASSTFSIVRIDKEANEPREKKLSAGKNNEILALDDASKPSAAKNTNLTISAGTNMSFENRYKILEFDTNEFVERMKKLSSDFSRLLTKNIKVNRANRKLKKLEEDFKQTIISQKDKIHKLNDKVAELQEKFDLYEFWYDVV